MVRENIINYLGIPHSYESGLNCITIIHEFFKKELGIDCIKELVPSNVTNARWMKQITLEDIDTWALKHGIKVPLTELQDCDVILFKSPRLNFPIHFGMFMLPYNMLHLEEGNYSKYEHISSNWSECIYAAYRHKSLV